ncbi:MAG: hypothetical protein H6713_31990 [Myxococcales bacterium]|nr:hypothetical protein [Myxococcales bacterium]
MRRRSRLWCALAVALLSAAPRLASAGEVARPAGPVTTPVDVAPRGPSSRLALNARDLMTDGFELTCAVDREDRTWCWGTTWAATGKWFTMRTPTRARVPGGPPAALTAACFVNATLESVCGGKKLDPAGALTLRTPARRERVLLVSDEGLRLQRARGVSRVIEPLFKSPIIKGDIVDIALGHQGSGESLCVLSRAGEVRCWETDYGPAGDLCCDEYAVADVDDAIAIADVCALRSGGAVVCWKSGGGDLREVASTSAVALVANPQAACVLRRDGSVLCFDPDDPRDTEIRAPPREPPIADAVKLVAGESHFCALERGGDVVCWGAEGQLGVDPTAARAGDAAASSSSSSPRAAAVASPARAAAP